MKDKYIKKERVSELTKKIIKLSDHLYPQTDEDIRKQIEDELKELKDIDCMHCKIEKICDGLLSEDAICEKTYLFNQLIEARKTIAAKKE